MANQRTPHRPSRQHASARGYAPAKSQIASPQELGGNRVLNHVSDKKTGPRWGRIFGLGALAITAFIGVKDITFAAKDAAVSVFNESQGVGVDLPDINTPEGKKELEAKLKSGEIVKVETDEDHPYIWHVANAVNGDAMVEDLRNRLTDQVGGEKKAEDLPYHTELYVPTTESAIELHNKQFPDEQIIVARE